MKSLFKSIIASALIVSVLMSLFVTMIFASENALQTNAPSAVKAGDEFSVCFVQPVTLTISSFNLIIAFDNTAFEIVEIDEPPYKNSLPNIANCNNDGNVSILYTDTSFAANTELASGTVLLNIKFRVKDTATEGSKDFTVNSYSVSGDYNEDTYENEDLTPEIGDKILTVKVSNSSSGDAEGDTTTDYTATLTAATDGVNQGDEVKVTVNVNKVFNSAKIELNYDATVLKFYDDGGALAAGQTMTGKDQAASYENKEANGMGTITILDFGSAFNAGAAYTLTFTSLKGGVTNVTVASAGFSTDEEAETKDLIAATGEGASVTINHKVTVNGEVSYVAPNGTYNGQIPSYNPANNTYDITVTMGGVEQTDPTIDEDGKFQITPVNGELTITYTVTPKQYTVTWDDAENVVTEKNPNTATVAYGTNITFKIPEKTPAVGATDGFYYKVAITYTGTETAITPVISGQTYTINGTDVTDAITIKVTKETESATQTTITVESSDEVQYEGNTVTDSILVNKDSSVEMTLIKQDGYTYTVTQYNGESEEGIVLPVADEGTFTVNVGDEAVKIVVTKTVTKTGLSVYETEYLSLDGAKMWLVLMNEEKVEDKTYTLTQGGNTYKFFWSDEYDAYCCLAISGKDDTFESVQESLEVEGVIGIANEGPISISYDGNVNMTFDAEDQAVVDINDAQLTWNMYNANYSDFKNISVEKFLRADVNHDYTVDTDDSAAIITMILGN